MKNQNKLTAEEALRIVASKGTISEAGIHRVTCTYVTPYYKERANGVKQVAIANFNAKSSYQHAAAITLLSQGDFDDAANQGLSLSILEGQSAPMQGQVVDLIVEEVTTKNGITGLFAQKWAPVPVQIPAKTSLEDLRKLVDGQLTESVEVVQEDVEEIAAPAFK